MSTIIQDWERDSYSGLPIQEPEIDDSYEAFPNRCERCGEALEIDNTLGYCDDICAAPVFLDMPDNWYPRG